MDYDYREYLWDQILHATDRALRYKRQEWRGMYHDMIAMRAAFGLALLEYEAQAWRHNAEIEGLKKALREEVHDRLEYQARLACVMQGVAV